MAATSASHWGAFSPQIVDGRIVAVRPFERDENPTPLIQSIPEVVHSRSRIDRPMVRRTYLEKRNQDSRHLRGSEPFVPVSWDDALELVAGELARIRSEYGNQAIFGGSYGWSSAGRVNHARTLLHRFLNSIGGYVGQLTNYSWGAAMMFLPRIVGDYEAVAGPVTDFASIVKNTNLFVLLGGANRKNAFVTSGGAGSHEYAKWQAEIRAAGIKCICISPLQRDAPPELGAEWLPIRPGTDTALLLGIAHTLATEGKVDEAFLDRYTVGYPKFRAYLLGQTDGCEKSVHWAAAICGIDAGRICDLAGQMAAGRTMLGGTWSLQRADHGEQPYWMIITLAAMLGQIGLPGGGFGFGYGSINGLGTPRIPISTPAIPEGANPVDVNIPVARVADLLLQPGRTIEFNGSPLTFPDIKLVYWAGGNPFHHHQEINRLLRAWRQPQTIVVNEPFWTATAKHADIVLPSTTPYERNDICSSPRDRFILAMPKLIEPVGQSRNDYDIFRDIAGRLGFGEVFTEGRTIEDWVSHAYEECRVKARRHAVEMPDFETFWSDGYVEIDAPTEEYVQFADFRRNPEKHPLKTPSGKIEIFSETIAGFNCDDCPGHATWLEPKEWLGSPLAAQFPLHMLSTQPSTRLHGQLDNGPVSRNAKISGREPIYMNTADANARGIKSGDVVKIFNNRGACLAGAVVTDGVVAGVVEFPTGAWYDPEAAGTIGSLDKHGNPNVLTRDEGTSKLGQGPSAQSALVEIEVWQGPLPAISAFDVPDVVEP